MVNNEPVLIHTHFHKRRTGITRSIENILPYLTAFETYIYGYNVDGTKISRFKLLKLLYSKRNVVVHCHRNNEMLRFLFLKVLGAKFKLVSTRHAETEPSNLSKFLFKKSTALVTLTEKMNKSIGIKNTLIPHGVDTDLFIPNKEVKESKKNAFKAQILCAGRVRKAKGQETLIKAIVPILKKEKEVQLLIVGKVDDAKYVENLKNIVADNNLQNQVKFIKETNDIVSYYQSAKIVVVPSLSEGFSLVCAEAMSCGVTTVATKGVGIHSKLIEDKKTGYLFEPKNVNELRAIILGLITDKLPFIEREARVEIQEKWSAKREADTLSTLYFSL